MIATLLRRLAATGLDGRTLGNCGSILRAWSDFRASTAPSGSAQPRMASAPSHTHEIEEAPPRPTGLASEWSDRTNAELLRGYGEILEELRTRGVVRTANNPVGDFAEYLCAQAFGWVLEANSAAGFDATGPDGLRYQIKARRLTASNGSRQLSAIRNLEQHKFDFLAAILFDANFSVELAVIAPFAIVKSHAAWTSHTNSWRLLLDRKLCERPEVADVTKTLQETLATG